MIRLNYTGCFLRHQHNRLYRTKRNRMKNGLQAFEFRWKP